MSAVEGLENINPLVKGRASERVILPSEQDDSVHDEFDAREIFGKVNPSGNNDTIFWYRCLIECTSGCLNLNKIVGLSLQKRGPISLFMIIDVAVKRF